MRSETDRQASHHPTRPPIRRLHLAPHLHADGRGPEERDGAADLHEGGLPPVLVQQRLLRLDEVGHVALLVQAPHGEAAALPVPGPPRDEEEVEAVPPPGRRDGADGAVGAEVEEGVHHGHDPVVRLGRHQLRHQLPVPEESLVGALPQRHRRARHSASALPAPVAAPRRGRLRLLGLGLGRSRGPRGEALQRLRHVVGVAEVELVGGDGRVEELQVAVLVRLPLLAERGARLDERDDGRLGDAAELEPRHGHGHLRLGHQGQVRAGEEVVDAEDGVDRD